MKKKILGIFATAALALCFAPFVAGNAFAEDDAINVPLCFESTTADQSGDGYSWVQNTKTLTLNGFNQNIDANDAKNGISFLCDATIIVTEGTTNNIKLTSTSADTLCGVYSSKSLNVKGEGVLNISATTSVTGTLSTYGILANQGSVSVDSTTINVNDKILMGICANSALTLTDAKFSANKFTKMGIECEAGKLTIASSTVVLTNDSSYTPDFGPHAIYSGSDITICGTSDIACTYSVKPEVDKGQYYGILAVGNILIADKSAVKTTGGAIGIISNGAEVIIAGGNVNSDAQITAIWANKAINIKGGNAVATAHSCTESSAKAFYSKGDINIGEATVTAKCIAGATNASSGYYGIRAKGNINFLNPTKLAIAGSTSALNVDEGKNITSNVILNVYTNTESTENCVSLTPASDTNIITWSDSYKGLTYSKDQTVVQPTTQSTSATTGDTAPLAGLVIVSLIAGCALVVSVRKAAK